MIQAQNLTDQVRSIANVTKAVAEGDLTRKIEVDARGEILELKLTVNSMVDSLRMFSGEVTRVAREVGTDGVLGGQAQVVSVSGEWRNLTDNVNTMSRRVGHDSFILEGNATDVPFARLPLKCAASLLLPLRSQTAILA